VPTPVPPPCDIAVIVVNYGTAQLAAQAVQSVLERDHGGLAVEIHLVDNASPDGDAATLQTIAQDRNWGARVQLYLETTNHGFGRGNNLVIDPLLARPTPPSKIFLLNPDAHLKNEAIVHLAQFLDANPKAGSVGAQIEKPSGETVTAAFRFPNAVAEFSSALSFGPVARLCQSRDVPLPPDLGEQRVDWIAGAAVMFRSETLQQVGTFDPAFFLYFEEVHLMQRIDAAGWENWYCPRAEVIHAEGAATGVKSGRIARKRRPAYWYHSWYLYYTKTQGRSGAAIAALAWIIGATGNFILSALRRKQPQAPLKFYRDITAHVLARLIGVKGSSND